MDQAQLPHPLPSFLPQSSLSKAAKSPPCWSGSFDSCFFWFWLEQPADRTTACNIAYLPLCLCHTGNWLPLGLPLFLGSRELTQESAHTNSQALFCAVFFRALFSFCTKAKAAWPPHTMAWSTVYTGGTNRTSGPSTPTSHQLVDTQRLPLTISNFPGSHVPGNWSLSKRDCLPFPLPSTHLFWLWSNVGSALQNTHGPGQVPPTVVTTNS